MPKPGVNFTVHIYVTNCGGYWKATVYGFPVYAYGATADEAEKAAQDGLDALFRYHQAYPRSLSQYLTFRGIEHNLKEIEVESVSTVPSVRKVYEMELVSA